MRNEEEQATGRGMVGAGGGGGGRKRFAALNAGYSAKWSAPAGLDRLVVKVSTMRSSSTAARPATLVMFDSIDSEALTALQTEDRGDLEALPDFAALSLWPCPSGCMAGQISVRSGSLEFTRDPDERGIEQNLVASQTC